MKKLLMLLFCVFSISQVYSQKDFNVSQKNLRTNIKSFLSEEGFMPKIDSDGDIKFKCEGNTYYVAISESDTSPMYLSLCLDYLYGEVVTKSKVERAIPELNFYKATKIICFEDRYSCRGEMYLVDADAFRYAFYKILKQISSMKQELLKNCSD